jgi:hypothetical protein
MAIFYNLGACDVLPRSRFPFNLASQGLLLPHGATAETLVPSGHVNPQILGVIRIAASLPLREEWYWEFKSENENIYNYAYGKYGH